MSKLYSVHNITKIKEYMDFIESYRIRIDELNSLINEMNKSKARELLIKRRDRLVYYQKNTQINLLNYIGGEHFYETWVPFEEEQDK